MPPVLGRTVILNVLERITEALLVVEIMSGNAVNLAALSGGRNYRIEISIHRNAIFVAVRAGGWESQRKTTEGARCNDQK